MDAVTDTSPRRSSRAGKNKVEPVFRRQHGHSLADLAYEAVVQAIFDREVKPGARLNIDALAAQLEMSNTPIREALTRATAQRLVVQDNNRGFTVVSLLTEREYHQLFDLRHLLEVHALESAKLDQQAIERLTAIISAMPSMEHGPAYSHFKEFNQADRELHRTLIDMAQNPFLATAWEGLHFHLQVGRLYAGEGVIDFGDALREHAEIVHALKEGDRGKAVQAASRHIERAEFRLKNLLPAAKE